MEIEGTIKLIKDVEEFASTSKQQIVVETNGQYPQSLPIDFFKDKIQYLDSFNVGDEVTVAINLRGSENNGKHYVSIVGWRITKKPLA